MIIYSKKIIDFIQHIKVKVKTILLSEVGVQVKGDRFYDLNLRASYPINIILYNHHQKLGYFDPEFYEMGFHERLMHICKEQLDNIIRHEIAHYLTFIEHGPYASAHGSDFRRICMNIGWGKEVYEATIHLKEEQLNEVFHASGVMRKIQKLLALSSSSNQNEAEQAIIKSQQLLLKHNIESESVGLSSDDERIVLKRILKQDKISTKLESIATITKTFFVNIIFKRTDEGIYLEILGSQVNVDIAEYVANMLNLELERLWDQAKSQFDGLKGTVAKNSFLRGIAIGYCNKIECLKKTYEGDIKNVLLVVERKLEDAQSMAYNKLKKIRSSAKHCSRSSLIGEMMGNQLNINPALNQSAKNLGNLIGF